MTTTSVLNRLPMTKKLRTELTEFMGMDFPVGLGSIPLVGNLDNRTLAKPPYLIIYPLWRTSLAGTWSQPDADVDWTYQISGFSERTDQLEWIRDKVTEFFLARNPDGSFAHPLDVEGMHVINRYLKEDVGSDPATAGGVIASDMRFGVVVTPDYTPTP